MERIEIQPDLRSSKKQNKITPIMAGVINQSSLYNDDGYVTHTGKVNTKSWQMMLIQLLARGYTAREAYSEIKGRGIAPMGNNTMYNFLSSIKKATGIKFRIDEMTQGDIDRMISIEEKTKAIPHNVSKKAGEKMMSQEKFSDMLKKREYGGRPVSIDMTDKEHVKKHARIIKKTKKIHKPDEYGRSKEDMALLAKLKRR